MGLRLGLDIDGVLADFRAAFRDAARECLKREVPLGADEKDVLSEREIDRVWKHVTRSSNWWMRLQPYEPGRIANLYALARAGQWEVCFMTKRPACAGDSVQFQTQSWLEQQGFYLPAVVTVPGSRGEVANALRLDLVVDDQFVNCAEVIGAGPTKALLMLREKNPVARQHAIDRGVGVVSTLAEVEPVLMRMHELMRGQRRGLLRLSEWFQPAEELLPHNPRTIRPMPPSPEASGAQSEV
jgi:hypothetical protein